MPAPCVVPLCTERNGGHSFPKDAILTKQWLLAIRRSYFKPTKFSRICKKHFVPEDYQKPKVSYAGRLLLKPDSVPTVFAWTVEELETSKSQRKSNRKKMTNIEVDYKMLYKTAVENHCHTILNTQDCTSNHCHTILNTQDCTSNHCHTILNTQDCTSNHCHTILNTQDCTSNHCHTILNTQDCTSNHCHTILNTQDCTSNHCHTILNTQDCTSNHCCTILNTQDCTSNHCHTILNTQDCTSNQCHTILNTQDCMSNKIPNVDISKNLSILRGSQTNNVFNVENYEQDDVNIKFYTGFDSFASFMYAFSFFEGDVKFVISKSKLNICNEFFLVCIKLRSKMTDVELCDKFLLEIKDVQNIFTAWINYLFFKLQNYSLWIPESLHSLLNLSSEKKARIFIVTSPIVNKISLKLSIIVSKTGNIIYISKCFNGNTTDQEMFLSIDLTDILLLNKHSLGKNELYWNKNESYDSDLSIKTVPVERIQDLKDKFECFNILTEYSDDIIHRIMFICFAFDRILYRMITDTECKM